MSRVHSYDELLLDYSELREGHAALKAENADLREKVSNRQLVLDQMEGELVACHELIRDLLGDHPRNCDCIMCDRAWELGVYSIA